MAFSKDEIRNFSKKRGRCVGGGGRKRQPVGVEEEEVVERVLKASGN